MADSPVTALSTGRAVIPGRATRRVPGRLRRQTPARTCAVPAPAVRNIVTEGALPFAVTRPGEKAL